MTCCEFCEIISGFLDGQLSNTDREAFEEHIADCLDCEVYFESLRDTQKLGRCVCDDANALPPDMPEQVVQAALALWRRMIPNV